MAYTDQFFSGGGKKAPYFEGWYFRHQAGDRVYAFIPSMAIDEKGRKSAYIQVISNTGSWKVPFSYSEFSVDERSRRIKIGKNLFSEAGMSLDIETNDLKINGEIRYAKLTPLKRTIYAPGIMGPFSYFNFMECYHGILSLGHELSGGLNMNHETLDFTGGKGYIEKDFGRSFPKSWVWYQCGNFKSMDGSVMLSIAKVPFLGIYFTGILCVCSIGKTEYRLASYYGARVKKVFERGSTVHIEIKQGNSFIHLDVKKADGHILLAPKQGKMERIIYEYPSTSSRIIFKKDGKILLDEEGPGAGFEQVL